MTTSGEQLFLSESLYCWVRAQVEPILDDGPLTLHSLEAENNYHLREETLRAHLMHHYLFSTEYIPQSSST
jgi:hypothetical protein